MVPGPPRLQLEAQGTFCSHHGIIGIGTSRPKKSQRFLGSCDFGLVVEYTRADVKLVSHLKAQVVATFDSRTMY